MTVEVRGPLFRLFFPVLMAVAALVTTAVFGVLGPVAGIKSGYVLLGLLVASLVYYTRVDARPTETAAVVQGRQYYREAVFGVGLLSVAAVGVASGLPSVDAATVRTAALVVGLPVGYAFLLFQIREHVPPRRLLTQVLALYAVDPLTKLLATDFYFGRGDIPKHVGFTELVTTTGTWQAIPETNLYHSFPGLQTLVGSLSLLSGLPEYESLVVTGILTYLVVVVAAYLLARYLFEDSLLPVCVALGLTLLGPIHRYSVYFFPQSLAVGLALVVVLAAYRYDAVPTGGYGRHLLVASPVVVALWFTHHLTTVLFAPLVACLLAGPVVADRLGVDGVSRPQALPLVAWVGGSVAFWLLNDVFVRSLVNDIQLVLGQAQASGAGAGAPVRALGTEVPEPLVSDALLSLLSVDAAYNILLVCVLSLGLLVLLREPGRYRRPAALVTVGVLGAGVMVRTPVDIHGLARSQLPVSLFVAFLVAAALYWLLPLPVDSMKRAVPALLLVVALAFGGPAHAADDLYGLHSGPDLWETRTLPETQKEFSAAEMTGFGQAAPFVDRYGLTVGTDWNSELGLSRYRYGLPARSFGVESDRITTDREVVLYRQRWVERSVRLVVVRTSFQTLLVSERWLDGMARAENKVYTTGDIGLVTDNSDAPYVEREGG